MNKDGSKIFVIIAFFIVAIILVVVMIVMIQNANKPEPTPVINQTELELNETQREYNKLLFDYKMVRKTNDYYNSNYLVSPLSLGYALKILEEGSAGNTSTQLQNLIGNYEVPDAVNIDNTISIANALFILTSYKGKINSSYINNVESKYSANVLYDGFTNADGINNWVNGKTFGMIPKALYSVNRNTKMMIVNTIALDIAWKQKMDSANTHSAKFTKIDRTQIDVAMMTDKNAFGYLENENARGIIKHYAVYDPTTGTTATQDSTNKIELEYIAIIPKTNINDYISKLDQYELSKLIQTVQVHSSTKDLVMNIPKYSYEFNHEYIKQILLDSNVTDAFDENADFSGIMSGLFVDDIIHKTFIEFGEEGTKAAAATIVTMEDSAIIQEKELVQIDFNQPFIYLIKEKNSTNLWFFGVVYEPMKWEEYQKLIEQAQRDAERAKRGY